jgi:hypothetical protein
MLDDLFKSMSNVTRDLDYDESCAYVLRTLFAIDTDLINNDVQLLRFLLHLHYDNPRIPHLLLTYIFKQLSSQNRFPSWDLENLIFDGRFFFRFLSERMNRKKGPEKLPLSRKEIRVYLDNLIEEGYIEGLPDRKGRPAQDMIVKRIERLQTMTPETYEDWLASSEVWAEAAAELYEHFHPETDSEVFENFETIKKEQNARFESWLLRSYGSLYNYPPTSPSMVHHIPRYIAKSVIDNKKAALVVIDGLSYSQWKIIKRYITTQLYHIRERSLFAWIPTLTTVSRQALLSGKIPLSIESFLHSTNREEKLWRIFWEDKGLTSENVFYKKFAGEKEELDSLHDSFSGEPAVAAIIIGKIDSIAHGQQQGSSMMHKEIAYWGETSYFDTLLSLLVNYFDEIYITSDHGNDEARGIGNLRQGVLVQEKGSRCRIYNEKQFLDEALQLFPQAFVWPKIGLPDTYMPLLAPVGVAFTKEGSTTITHGGISIDEVIVPFITITKGSP